MAEELNLGCARPTGGPVGEAVSEASANRRAHKEESQVVLIGKKAPDFTAPGYHQGRFTSITLSDYFGKWVLLCFYPGDFTFV
jgi:peroxiredoxin (alkyl hydroperoxide reductase subunit C)